MFLADLIVPSPALSDNDEAAPLSHDSRVASLLISGKPRWLSLPVRLVFVGVLRFFAPRSARQLC